MKNFYEGGSALSYLKQRRTFRIQRKLKISLNSFQCLLLSLSTIYYQFSCYVQKSRARGTTGEGDKGKKQAVMKPSWSMVNVMSFNTLLIHCYYFEHTWLILRPYIKATGIERLLPRLVLRNDWKTNRVGLLTIFCVLFSFASIVEAKAQELRQGGATGQAAIKPLEIGDTIPEELWHLPLQVVNHPEGKETITLADYKDKLIILDFWATWCAPCIKSMEKLDSIYQRMDDVVVIPTTYESIEKVKPFLENRNLLLPSVLSHSDILRGYFPHRFIPHQIWILNNEVRAIPKSEDVDIESIQKILTDDTFKLRKKNDLLDYDASTNITVFAEKTKSSILSTSSFTTYIEGAPSLTGIRESEGRAIVNYINVRPLLMYAKALETRNNRIIVQSDHLYKAEDKKSTSKNVFSYQLIMPNIFEDRLIKRRVLSDLNAQFNVQLDSQIMNVDCYVISKLSETDYSTKNNNNRTIDIFEHDDKVPQAFSDFVGLLNFSISWTPDQPIFIDESGYSGSVTTEPYRVLQNDIGELKANLRPYGLTVTMTKRPMRMYILSDLKDSVPTVE